MPQEVIIRPTAEPLSRKCVERLTSELSFLDPADEFDDTGSVCITASGDVIITKD